MTNIRFLEVSGHVTLLHGQLLGFVVQQAGYAIACRTGREEKGRRKGGREGKKVGGREGRREDGGREGGRMEGGREETKVGGGGEQR